MSDDTLLSFLTEYQKRIELFREHSQTLRNIPDYDSWIVECHNCADEIQEIYTQNDKSLKELLFPYFDGSRPLDEKSADELYRFAEAIYLADAGDLFLLWEVLELLVPYYEEKHDLERLVFLYLGLGYTNLEISRVVLMPYGKVSVSYYEKIVAYEEEIFTSGNVGLCRRVAVAYANLLIVLPSISSIPLEKSYQHWLHVRELQKMPRYETWRTTMPDVVELLDLYADRFSAEGYEFYSAKPEGVSRETAEKLKKISRRTYERSLAIAEDLMDMPFETYVTQIKVQLEEKRLTTDEAWKNLHKYYLKKMHYLDKKKDDIIDFYVLCTLTLLDLLPKTTMDSKEVRLYANDYLGILKNFVKEYDFSSHLTYSINNVLSEMAFYPSIYQYMDSADEKIRFMYQLVITRHMVTCLHSHMVARIAVSILKCMIDKHPEMLVGCHDLTSVEEVQASKKKLLNFIHRAGLLHDIGKSYIIDIIDTQYRPIFDHEFQLIQIHPDKGADALQTDSDLSIYADIARGHHKSYNGAFGYPKSFDASQSKDKCLIDLIAICDSLDAATDTLGRNYRHAKNVATVLEEFREGAGTRYHPGIVSLIENDSELQQELENIVTRQREEVAKQLINMSMDLGLM